MHYIFKRRRWSFPKMKLLNTSKIYKLGSQRHNFRIQESRKCFHENIYIIICILIITASFKKEVDQEEKRTFQNHNKNRCNLIWTNWQQMIYSVSYYNIHLQVLCTCSKFCSFIKCVHGLVVYTENKQNACEEEHTIIYLLDVVHVKNSCLY